jgi:hypothetical protein
MITTLSELIARVESAGNLFAVRLEPKYNPAQSNALKCAGVNRCTYPTAEMLCRCSWGLYQIMGDNLYSLGLDVPISRYWNDAEMQADYFAKFLEAKKINFTLDQILNDKDTRERFALKYNGSLLYADRLINVYNQAKGN